MDISQWIAAAGAVVLALIILFHLLLAAGLPLGKAAWGGQHRILPARLRLGSVVAIVILAVGVWVILARVSLVPPGADPLWVRIASWLFAAYLVLNTLGNLASKSRLERAIMTPATAFLAVAFAIGSLS